MVISKYRGYPNICINTWGYVFSSNRLELLRTIGVFKGTDIYKLLIMS